MAATRAANCDGGSTVIVRQLGRQPYKPIWQAMKDFTDNRDVDTVDEIWLVEHDPVFTQGQAGKPEHVLLHSEIPIVQCDRGGQVTYHGPGQAMVYLLIDIKRKKIGVRDFVTIMEQAVIALLDDFSIDAGLKDGAPGVYVDGAKISALGLRVRRGATYHGLALNIAMDLSPFQQINPCGYEGMAVTDMQTLLSANTSDTKPAMEAISLSSVSQLLLEKLTQALDINKVLWQGSDISFSG